MASTNAQHTAGLAAAARRRGMQELGYGWHAMAPVCDFNSVAFTIGTKRPARRLGQRPT
jgi:hypothetical protein